MFWNHGSDRRTSARNALVEPVGRESECRLHEVIQQASATHSNGIGNF
jgi:hypothetical protein